MSAIPGLNTAILDFCTRLDDGPRDEAAARRERPRRDPEEYKWLREALASIEQPEHRLKKLLEVIDNVEVSSKDDHAMNSFEEIQDMVEDLNLATEFGLMKGHKRILNLLRVTRDETVRQYSAMIVAHSSQNHEKLQLLYLDEGVFDVLIPLLVNETHPGARASLVFAISSVCRGCDVTSTAFLKSGGLGALLAVISGHAQDDAKTVARCLALAGYFAESQSTTALPIATVASALATASPASPEVSLIDAAAGAASSILLKASASGPSGEAIAKSMLDQLSNWYDSTSDVPENDLGSERVALRAAYATTRQTLRNGSSNKKPTEVLHTPTCVAGAPPVLGLAAPPSAAA